MERNKSAKIKTAQRRVRGDPAPDTEGNLMKSVAQTIIEADRFTPSPPRPAASFQAVESVGTAATSVWVSTSASPSRSGLCPRGRRRLPYPQPRFRQAHRPDDDRHRKRHLAPPVGGRGRHFPDVEDGAHPAGTVRLRPCGLPASASTPWHGYCGRRCAQIWQETAGEDQLWTILRWDRAARPSKAEESPLRSRPRLLPCRGKAG